jgi:uncharacterized 2Fe-2S/4Fe-4S cluster protein (DUF4445 family)
MENMIHIQGGESFSYEVGESLFTILTRRNKGVWYGDSPCGGKGTCGKCKVSVIGNDLPPLSEKEKTSLTVKEQDEGVRLACLLVPWGEVTINLDKENSLDAVIQQDHLDLENSDSPLSAINIVLPPCSLEDQRDTLSALREEAEKKGVPQLNIPFSLLSSLPGRTDTTMTLRIILLNGIPIDIREDDSTEKKLTGAVIDLGTTTVVLYLVDLIHGKVIDTTAAMNAQKSRGGDVISRIDYACQNPESLKELQETIGHQLQNMAGLLMNKHGIKPDLFLITGNPTMVHLLTGLNPRGIAQAPFVPQITETLTLDCGILGWNDYSGTPLILPASLSGYIGSDILAGVIFTEMDRAEKNTILLDLGTNGELVMGNHENMLACSCAAGPAFEGANISAGMAGIAGALSHVDWESENYSFKTIADEPAVGICGTGIIDLMALLLDKGIVDETGRFLDDNELPSLNEDLRRRIVSLEGGRAFLAADKSDGATKSIYFTQKDVREVQMARAAIAGAVLTLLRERNIELEDLDKFYLAGGFGFWLREESAIRIGLIPSGCSGKVEVVGNSSGKGGLLMALDKNKLARADQLRREISYLELSSNLMYQNDFIMSMTFPEEV